MQITVTDHNEWEGEDFSFILEVDDKTAKRIYMNRNRYMSVELNTAHTPESIKAINIRSDNGYMDRIGFYEINKPLPKRGGLYEKIFYKANGLTPKNHP